MEFNLREMNSVARDLLSGVSDDVEFLRQQGHASTANRLARNAMRLSALADNVEQENAWKALNATLVQLQRVTAEKSADVGALLRELGDLHEEIKQAVAAKHGKMDAP
jgi:uncharacterized coiled-coil protein SlyX